MGAAHFDRTVGSINVNRIITQIVCHSEGNSFNKLGMTLLGDATVLDRLIQITILNAACLPVSHLSTEHLELIILFTILKFHVSEIRGGPIRSGSRCLKPYSQSWTLDFCSFLILSFDVVELSAMFSAVFDLTILRVGSRTRYLIIEFNSPSAHCVNSGRSRIPKLVFF